MMSFLVAGPVVSTETGVARGHIPVALKSRTCFIPRGSDSQLRHKGAAGEVSCWFRFLVLTSVPLHLTKNISQIEDLLYVDRSSRLIEVGGASEHTFVL